MSSSNHHIYEVKKKPPPSKKIKSRDREQSRRRIMQAALEIFSEVGYDAATTKTIAKKAELNEVLLFRYFDSKENLLFEILNFFLDNEHPEDFYPSGKSVEKEIMNFFRAKLKFNMEAQNFMKIIVSRSLVDPIINKLMAKKGKARFTDLLTRRLIDFQEKGNIRPEIHITSVVSIITDQVFMTTFYHRVLATKSTTLSLRQFEFFAKILTQGIQ